MATEINPLAEGLNKILGTNVKVGQRSEYKPPTDPVLERMQAETQRLIAQSQSLLGSQTQPAPVGMTPGVETALAAATPAPVGTAREYLAGQGMTPQGFRALGRPERQALRGQYQAAKSAATPVAGTTQSQEGATPAAGALPWMGYNEYYAGNPEAQKYKQYSTNLTGPAKYTGSDWDAYGGDPRRFQYEYNKYRESLPLIYQDLINYGISPESVASGEATSLQRQFGQEIIPTDPNEAMRIYGTTRGGPSDQGIGLNIKPLDQLT